MFLRPALVPALPGILASMVAAQELPYADVLRRVTDLERLCRPVAPGERCIQFSSYDRRSDAGPADAGAWYANADAGQFLRTEEREGRTEHVMVDVAGPGAVVRIWSANPKGHLHFYLDGAAEPTWTVDFAQLTSGRMEPLLEPLAGVRARGANCHLPIPFARHLKVTASEGGFYYQVNVSLSPGEVPESFRPAFLTEYASEIEACRSALAEPAPVPAGAQIREAKGSSADRLRLEVPKGSVVRSLEARVVPAAGDGVDPATRYRQVLVVVKCGGKETVRVPFADFFGAAPDLLPYQGYALGVHPDRTGYCRFPMPMPDGGEVALLQQGGSAARLELRLAVTGIGELGDGLALHADWHQAKGIPTRPFSEHRVLDARGAGRFAGCALMVRNPVKGWWGEGDEKFFVDGEDFPSTFGTGTEDYFGYAWCCPDPFASAFHAQPQCDGPANYGFTSVNRVQVADAVPFHESFRFDLEVWHWTQDITVDYATVAYWYAAPTAGSGLPPVPPAAERAIERLPVYEVHVVEGAMEGEKLKVLGLTGGRHLTQEMGGFTSGKWSREGQLWWMDGQPGDRLSLALPVEAAGRYRMFAAFTKADDYGTVQVRVGDRKVGEPLDCYNASVVPSGEIDLGEVELEAGQAELVLELTGRNAKAKPRHMVGLDYVRLVEVR